MRGVVRISTDAMLILTFSIRKLAMGVWNKNLLAEMDSDFGLLKAMVEFAGTSCIDDRVAFVSDLITLLAQHGYPALDDSDIRSLEAGGALDGRVIIKNKKGSMVIPRVLLTRLFERVAENQGFEGGDYRAKVVDWFTHRYDAPVPL
jgi:hypothetical protein